MTGDQALEEFQAALLDDDAEKLYDRAPCGYLSTTPDGTVIKVNQTFLTWTGYSRHEIVGRRTFASLLTAGGRIYHETHYAPMLRMQDSVRAIALDIVTARGGRLPVLVNSVLERGPSGAPAVVRTAVFDATERRAYERELLGAKQRAEESEDRARALARTLQQSLIPPLAPDIPGLDVAAVYRPAGEEVGGDFYDIFQVSPTDWFVAIGDVCGKGVDAAVVAALVRHVVRGVTVRVREPSEVLGAMNAVLLQHESDRFCTATLVRLSAVDGSWTATVACGGHPPPLLTRSGGHPSSFGHAGSLLGVLEEPMFAGVETLLEPGDSMVLYTDGVPEGRCGEQFYGSDRLEASIQHGGSAVTMAETLVSDVVAFQQGRPRDDIAVVVVRVPARADG